MNINLHQYEDTVETLAETIHEHQEILSGTGERWRFTGETCLVSPPEPDLARTGAMQVWSKTDEGMWVHVTPDGVAVEAACPLGD